MATANLVAVDRAGHELRSGRPVNINGVDFIHPEFLNEKTLSKLKRPKLIITAHRAHQISKGKYETPQIIDLKGKSLDDIQFLLSCTQIPKNIALKPAVSKPVQAAIELAQILQLLPAAVTSQGKKGFKISSKDILNYQVEVDKDIKLVTEAPLKLKDAKKASIKAFRSGNGASEHYAIIIGNPEKEPLVRIHSSCYTGDLLGSLTCDCGDQLRGAIKMMDKAGGGIIIYLMQEGRGIGLINKLRAYKLQAGGMDTVDANEFLGFNDEERSFDAAATILKSIGFKKVRLVTNNPKKTAGLEKLGIKISERVPLIIKHEHNTGYLTTKSKKSGHLI